MSLEKEPVTYRQQKMGAVAEQWPTHQWATTNVYSGYRKMHLGSYLDRFTRQIKNNNKNKKLPKEEIQNTEESQVFHLNIVLNSNITLKDEISTRLHRVSIWPPGESHTTGSLGLIP